MRLTKSGGCLLTNQGATPLFVLLALLLFKLPLEFTLQTLFELPELGER